MIEVDYMSKTILLSLVMLGLLIAGCTIPQLSGSEVVCNSPYIRVGTSCCLDKNSNAICDSDEQGGKPSTNLTTQEKQNCTYTALLTAITSNLQEKSNECRQSRIYALCNKCATCCSSPGVEKTEYVQQTDPTCYSCASTNFGVARARDYYDMMGAYSNKCAENCPDLVEAYKAFLQYGKDYNCNLPSGWMICSDVSAD